MFVCLKTTELESNFLFLSLSCGHTSVMCSLYVCTVTVAQCAGASVECSDSVSWLVFLLFGGSCG